MANRFPLIFNSGAGQIQELAASDNLDLTSSNLVNAGILFTSSGSQTAPSISIGNGTTYPPGLYSPGTDQLAVATNGTGRVFVDADGNINLGQASSALQSAGTGLTVYGASSSEIKFLNSTTGALATDGTALVASSTGFTINNREAGSIILGTSNTERLRLSSTGEFIFKGAGAAGSTQAVSFNGSAPINSLVIDSSGRLGIGIGSPDTHLHLYASNASASIRFTNTAASKVWELNPSIPNVANSGFSLHNVTDSTVPLHVTNAGLVGIGTVGPNALLNIASTGNGYRVLIDDTTNDNTLGVYSDSTSIRHVVVNNARGAYKAYGIQSNGITFSATNGSTSATITSAGLVGIGTTNPTSKLHVIGDALVSGIITATTFQSTSDINLKENIKTVNNSLNIVSQLRGVTFDWKNTHQASIGVIAQEVEQILPELVSGGENKTVNYNGIIGILVEAIKEQEVRIEKLENKLNAQ